MAVNPTPLKARGKKRSRRRAPRTAQRQQAPPRREKAAYPPGENENLKLIMATITLKDVGLSFGGLPLLNGIDLQIEPGERLCLVGRNGEGKSSLMKILAGELEPDRGEITRQKGLRVSRLTQEVPATLSGTVYEVVAGGLGEMFALISRYHAVSHLLQTDHSEAVLAELAEAPISLISVGAERGQIIRI